MPFNEYHMPLLRQIPKAQLVGDNPDEKSPAGWFSYFWSEAYPWEQDFLRQTQRLLPLFNRMFDLPAQWEPAKIGGMTKAKLDEMKGTVGQVTLRRRTEWDTIARTAPQVLLDALEGLLIAGFRRVPITKNSQLAPNDTSMEMAAYLKPIDHRQKIQLGWRGDTRRFADLVSSGGFICKAEATTNDYAKRLNMRETWHPFSKPTVRGDMWYRRVSADNCKMTVISITRDFKTASVFPQLSEVHVFPGVEAENDIAELVRTRQVDQNKLSAVTVRRTTGQEVKLTRFVDQVQIFLCVLNGVYFDTEEAQQNYSQTVPFREIGLREVPADDLLAAVTYIRVHHGTTNRMGFTAIHDAAASVEVSGDILRRRCEAYTGPQLFQAALQEYEQARQTFTAAWGEQGAIRAGAKLDPGGPGISEVIRIEPLSGGPITYQRT